MRLYLAVFFTFVAVFYTTRIFLLKQKGRTEVVHPGSRFSGTWWNHMVFRFFRGLIWGTCVLRVFVPSVDLYLGPIAPLQKDGVILFGAALLTAGFGLALVSHFALGRGWQSGFDEVGPTTLCIRGPYRYSRNPAFLGVIVAQVGFWLALPTLFSSVCLVVGVVAVVRQAMAEERFLEETLGDGYAQYRRNVRRWV
ncbi:methyltransferase family protein [Shimia biformata]|uniref:methyltransferase family protein n=1 Tax=Shimia biformata TaxID=1294299 RepID=UPI00195259DD|nr:isoprenylcysteine carboxylmethyltransferase family protein [Shimia biformata]